MSVLNRSHLNSVEVVTGTKMVQTYKIAVLGDGGVGKSGEPLSYCRYPLISMFLSMLR